MKVLGYFFCALAVVIGALMVLDQLFMETAHQIWDILNYVNCAALALCVILGILLSVFAFLRWIMAETQLTEGHGCHREGMRPSTGILLSVFAFLVYTETWIAYMAETQLPTLQWMWVDAIAVLALEGPSAMMIWYAGWFIALVAEESKYKSLSH